MFKPMVWAVVCAVLLTGTAARAADVVTTIPAVPRPGQPITLVIHSECGCPMYTELTRTGFTIDLATGDGCVSACLPQTFSWNLGVLPAGEYTVVRHRVSSPGQVVFVTSFLVAPAPDVPTLSPSAIAALALALTALALAALRK